MNGFLRPLILTCCLGLAPAAAPAQEAALDAKLQAFFASFQAAANMPSAGNVTLQRAYLDLGGSAVPEALVVFNGSLFCGSRGCSAVILDMSGPQARSIGDFIAVSFTPLESRTNGYRDVAMGAAILQFDGATYRVTRPATR